MVGYHNDKTVVAEAFSRGERPDLGTTMASGPLDELVALHEELGVFAQLDELEVHYTPKHGSWLNMAEIEFSVLTRQCLDRRIGLRTKVEREVAAWQAKRNGQAVSINWRFTTTDARIKLKHLYPSLAD
jgi:hypothetical protein